MQYSRAVQFEKWQGLGNNYLIVRRDEWQIRLTPERAALLCDVHFGVGGDGILEVDHEHGHPRMTVWNPDGSIAENCGNGIRMVTRHLVRRGKLPGDGVIITGGGPVKVRMLPDDRVRVAMGKAVFPDGEGFERLETEHGEFELAHITTGNPHAIIVHDDPDSVVRSAGRSIEVHPRFPGRTNVEFIRIDGPSEITMRVWERGVGETMACGTGACASAVAAVRLAGRASPVTVHLAGGDLEIDVDDDLEVTMTGPAELLYEGVLSPALSVRLEAL